MLQSALMPDIKEYLTIKQAAARKDVPYTPFWLRRLAEGGKVEAIKIGEGLRGQWLIYLPSLLKYIEKMKELGDQKHDPLWDSRTD